VIKELDVCPPKAGPDVDLRAWIAPNDHRQLIAPSG
jgi:hypothetical protein